MKNYFAINYSKERVKIYIYTHKPSNQWRPQLVAPREQDWQHSIRCLPDITQERKYASYHLQIMAFHTIHHKNWDLSNQTWVTMTSFYLEKRLYNKVTGIWLVVNVADRMSQITNTTKEKKRYMSNIEIYHE